MRPFNTKEIYLNSAFGAESNSSILLILNWYKRLDGLNMAHPLGYVL